ncbi:odorant receptor 131-2-like [Megalops cyprinoides]|uniref:odorant receptor 131-2-like n=1 Tax=Megalops cyprinoides TaxID=118141 RepID=UPI00186496D1|nr:odorant receptor 131-2-like [Megalops cyprinoides]
MAKNSTQSALGMNIPAVQYLRLLNARVLVVQALVCIFLYVNCLMIFTFFKKEAFRNNVRYILFAHTLFCDTLFLIISDALLLMSFSGTTVPVGLCMVIYAISGLLNFATPLTLTAMCLERYVAICMPLRHAEISTRRRAIYCIFVIHAVSSIQQFIIFFMVVSSSPLSLYSIYLYCSVENLLVVKWQQNVRSAMSQLYFLAMSVTIAFTYIKIMAAARAASSDNQTSTAKGLRTVLLHAFQMTLGLIMLWLPLIEMAVMEVNLHAFIELRYFDYITFILAPRCLCPLVYGLRDKQFVLVLKYYFLYAFYKKVAPVKKPFKSRI